jgi:hypothetical protein
VDPDGTNELAESHLFAFARELEKRGTEPRRQHVRLEAAGRIFSLTVAPVRCSEESETACEEAVRALLKHRLGEPISGRRARKALERNGFGVFGEATVRRTLRRLHRAGEICNSRKGKPGYFDPNALPLAKAFDAADERAKRQAEGKGQEADR